MEDSAESPKTASPNDVSQTTEFLDAQTTAASSWTECNDPTFASGSTPNVPLADWLSRPRRIQSFAWTTAVLNESFNPWLDFLGSVGSVEKLRSFAMLQGNLKLRFVINGSPFIYGRSIASYLPFHTANCPDAYMNLNCSSQNNPALYCYESQRLHGYLDPSTNHTLEFTLPFLTLKNWMRLYAYIADESAPNVFECDDIETMGLIRLKQINGLQDASNAAGAPAVTISVFAWFDSLELAVPTATDLGYTPMTMYSFESGKSRGGSVKTSRKAKPRTKVMITSPNGNASELKQAANGTTTVSGIASAVAAASGQLTSIPMIGPFASAAEVTASALSRVAKIFGFSRPLQLGDVQRFKPEPYASMANTTGADTAYKFSADPQNNVTVDPRVTGFSGDDEMTIQGIAAREAYLTTFTWTDTNAPITSSATLFRSAVTPMLSAYDERNVTTGQVVVEPTPMAFAATPFRYWYGDITFRFQVVASQYHRGKVVVFYEPNLATQDLLASVGDFDFTRHFSKVVDLEDLDNLEITIPWASPKTWLETGSPALVGGSTDMYFPSVYQPVLSKVGQRFQLFNGFIEVRVVNELASALDIPTPVDVNVFVRCDNLRVAHPKNLDTQTLGVTPVVTPLTMFSFEAGDEPIDGFDTSTNQIAKAIFPSEDPSQLEMVGFGESIKSFRSLMKRFNFVQRGTLGSVTNPYCQLIGRIYPPTAWYNSGTYFSTQMHMFDYLRYAFLGVRGGYRYKVALDGVPSEYRQVQASNATLIASDLNGVIATDSTSNASNIVAMAGGQAYQLDTNMGVEFEIPYYSANRFYLASSDFSLLPKDVISQSLYDGGISATQTIPGWRVNYEWSAAAAPVNASGWTLYGAAADDFSFVGFVGAPPRYVIIP